MSEFDDDDMIQDAFTLMTFRFKTLRVIDNVLIAYSNSLKTEVHVSETCTETELAISLEKIHFWYDRIVSSAIIFDRTNDFALNMMFDENGRQICGNMPMACPEPPNDDLLAMIFQSKMNALSSDNIAFTTVELTSDSRENMTSIFAGYASLYLPMMSEWVGERSFHEVPWWQRDDGETIDMIPGPEADLANPPKFGYDMSFIEKRFLQKDNDTAIIIKPDFKPRVISGGLDNDKTED
jgi:hypothetical protein